MLLSKEHNTVTKLKHTFKTDILFKLLFVKHPHLLKQLVARLLSIPPESIGEFVITNPEMPPESLGDKFCRLDIAMTVDGQRVDLEVQVSDEGDFSERLLYYWAREFSSALPAGGKYHELPRTIVISITNFAMYDCVEFASEFQVLEVKRHTPFSDKFDAIVFELPKLPEVVSAEDELQLWLALFKADTEEELARIKSLGVEVMDQAIDAYHSVVVSPEFKERERLYAKARHDEAQALWNAERRAKEAEREIWQGVVAEKDTALAEKDTALAEKDAEIERLRALLKE
jgi:predicted transposase/invertase (TIGR01784 family)